MKKAQTPPTLRFQPDEKFGGWFKALEDRYLSDLTFREVRRGLQALSAGYVEARPGGIDSALKGAGKRAAFAMFYAPLHFLLVQAILRELGARAYRVDEVLDLGCGTGAAGAAWALEAGGHPRVIGVERHPWAAAEALWSWAQLGVNGHVRRIRLERARLPGRYGAVLMAFTANELDGEVRTRLLGELVHAADRGARVCVVEPIARGFLPWWNGWARAFEAAGGLASTWRFRVRLPETLQLMDRAAGLDHQLLTGRSLWLAGDTAARTTPATRETDTMIGPNSGGLK